MLQPELPRHIAQAIRNAEDLVFDVDLTLTERQKPLSLDLATTLQSTGKRLGICTSRAQNELDEIFQFTQNELLRPNLIKGPVILEDGGLLIAPGAPSPQLLVPQEQHEAVQSLVTYLLEKASPLAADPKWSLLEGLPAPMVHLPIRYNYQTSFSVWQHTYDGMETLRELLPHTMQWCETAVRMLGLEGKIALSEIGDGTLRIAAPGRNKGVALRELHEQGIINLSRTVYFGDGRNDIPAAQTVREHEGCIVAVDTHCRELVGLANYVTPAKGPEGLRRLLVSTTR